MARRTVTTIFSISEMKPLLRTLWRRADSFIAGGGPSAELSQTRGALEWETAVSRSLSQLYEPLISAEATTSEMAGHVLDEACRLTNSRYGYVATLARGGQQEIVTKGAAAGAGSGGAKREAMALPRNHDGTFSGLRGQVFNTGRAYFTNDPGRHPAFEGCPDWHVRIERFLSVPVALGGKPGAQIAVANSGRDYTQKELAAVRRIAALYGLALQRKRARDRMIAALEEKEVLLREIHHRVKNNLQVISSLLNLQAGSLTDPDALELLQESQNRVRSMAMVHEQLHRSHSLSRIAFREYVRNLTAGLFSSYGVSSSKVALRIDVSDVCLPLDQAVPCGLLIQELVSNSLKYAFPPGRQGEIRIGLGLNEPERMYRLRVRDNGVGLPAGVSPANCTSLGLRLVRILAEQLNATLHYGNNSGAEYRIEFPDSNEDRTKQQ